MLRVGDKVKITVRGTHQGKNATVIKEISVITGKEKWFLFQLDDGKKVMGPESSVKKGE